MKKNLPQIYRLHRIWGLPTKQSFFRIDPILVCKYICVWFAKGDNGSTRGCRWGIRSSVSNALFLGEEQVFPRWGTGCWSVRKKTDGFRLLLLRGEKRSVSICGQPEKAWLLWFSKCYGRVGESTLEKRSVYIALHWAYNWALFERRSNEMLYIEGRIGEKLDIVQSIYSSICFWLALMYKGRQKDRFVQIE